MVEKSMAIPGLPGGLISSTRETHLFPLGRLWSKGAVGVRPLGDSDSAGGLG